MDASPSPGSTSSRSAWRGWIQFTLPNLLWLMVIASLALASWSDRKRQDEQIQRLDNTVTLLRVANDPGGWAGSASGACGYSDEQRIWSRSPLGDVTRMVLHVEVKMGLSPPGWNAAATSSVSAETFPRRTRYALYTLLLENNQWLHDNFASDNGWQQFVASHRDWGEKYRVLAASPVARRDFDDPPWQPNLLIPVLRKLLRDGPNGSTRAIAASLLAHFGEVADPAAADLADALNDQDQPVRIIAARSILHLSSEAKKSVAPRLEELLDRGIRDSVLVLKSLCRIDASVDPLPRLTKLFADQDADVRLEALATLIELGPEKAALAMPEFRPLSADSDPRVRLLAAFALGKVLSSPKAVEILTTMAKQEKDVLGRKCIAQLALQLQTEGTVPKTWSDVYPRLDGFAF